MPTPATWSAAEAERLRAIHTPAQGERDGGGYRFAGCSPAMTPEPGIEQVGPGSPFAAGGRDTGPAWPDAIEHGL